MKKFLSLVLALTLTLSLCVIPAHAEGETTPGVTLDESSATLIVGDTTTLTADPSEGVTWSSSKPTVATVTNGTVTAVAPGKATIKASVGSGDEEVCATCEITVKDRYEIKLANSARNVTVTVGNSATLKAPTLYDNKADESVSKSDYAVTYALESGDSYIDVENNVVTAKKIGTGEVKATVTYTDANENKFEGTVTYTIKVEAPTLAITLDKVVNGDREKFSKDELNDAVLKALKNAVPGYKGNKDVDKLYLGKTGVTGGEFNVQNGTNLMDESYVWFEATTGFLGNAVFSITAKIDDVTYDGKLTVPVTEDSTIRETVSATEDGSDAVFTLPDSYYEVWYISSSKSSTYDKFFDGKNEVPGWDGPFDYTDEIKVSLKSFDKDGTLTFNVVGLDDDGVASIGTLTVTLDLYNIEYSGAAGSDIYFAQKDFEAYLQDRAESAGIIGGRKSTAYVDFDHVTFSIPSTTQGVLYNASSKIDRKTECTNLDRVNFVPAAKASGQIYIDFVVYGDYYASSTATKSTNKSYSGRVLVNVVREDIKYTVTSGKTVTFKASDFQSYFTATYKSGTLSYVTFGKLPDVTAGMLYTDYSAYSANTAVKTGDKFYYEPTKTSYNDLDNVTFKPSTWVKVGDKVYIPFTAYGTKSSQSVEGWVTITVATARVMNFTDVKTTDWFYSNVKNAYEMGLIEGKTATTFNPNDNMTYAEAIVLACRMNQLYYNGSVSLSNSKTGNWYDNYMNYALQKGIISKDLSSVANKAITRKDYVDIFYNALPATSYTVKNTVNKIPDLTNNADNAKVYTFYKAGILTGYANTPGKAEHAFGPNDNIKRSEVATILIRMMDASTRVYFYI